MVQRIPAHGVFEDEDLLLRVGLRQHFRHAQLRAEITLARAAVQRRGDETAAGGVFMVIQAEVDLHIFVACHKFGIFFFRYALLQIIRQGAAGGIALAQQQDHLGTLPLPIRQAIHDGVRKAHIQPGGGVHRVFRGFCRAAAPKQQAQQA